MFANEISAQAATIMIIVLLAFLTFIMIFISGKRQEKRFRAKLRAEYGKMPNIRYAAEEYESIGLYARDKAAGMSEYQTAGSGAPQDSGDAGISGASFYIDDTTWNDVDMDDIFLMVNQTVSSCGEDILYAMMRLPAFSEETLAERNRLIEWFGDHPKEREDVQYILARVGRKRHMSQYEYITKLDEAQEVHTARYAALLVLAVINIALFFIQPVWGVICLSVLLGVNLKLQFSNNDKTRIYVQSFNSVLRLLHASRSIAKLKLPALESYVREMNGIRKEFAGFERGSYFVTSMGQVSNGPADAVMEYLKLFFHVDMLKFNQMLHAFRGHREECMRLLEILGLLDACMAVSSFRAMKPDYTKPVFTSDPASVCFMRVRDMVHPLIGEPVANSFTMTGGNLITGSNASGKSTFLKNCAICAILAQSIDTVPASYYEADFMKVMSSMALSDNLAAKESYFIVELKSIKRILDEAKKGEKVLCLIDEVLRGTNTVERIAASSKILEALCMPNVLSFAATHDIELTYLLDGFYTNWHFEENVTDDDVTFDYMLREGRAASRNAIRLLSVIGFEENIIREARERAERFDATGVWS